MSIYDIYDDHKEFQKYVNMGIKLTVLIPVLQKNEIFSISTHTGIKKTELFIFKILPFVFPFIKWEYFGGPLNLSNQ